MFSFDGSYRRTPSQSLGGVSRSSDRDTLIRKAQEERAKRAEVRRQTNASSTIQSHVRSFLLRQRIKTDQRTTFDGEMRLPVAAAATPDSTTDAQQQRLERIIARLLFFYYRQNRADGERLIQLCQSILRSPALLAERALRDQPWRIRLQRLLLLCTRQIGQLTVLPPTIPFRMLETFTNADRLRRLVPSATDAELRAFLDRVYAYLVRGDYFRLLRQMLDQRLPPLDGPQTQPPNALADTLLQMLMQPLRLVSIERSGSTLSPASRALIVGSFVEHVLVPEFSDAVRLFVLPALALPEHDFPFGELVVYLDAELREQRHHEFRIDCDADGEKAAPVVTTSVFAEDTDGRRATKARTPSDETPASMPAPLRSSAFLLNALLTLDRAHHDRMLGVPALLAAYIRVVASLSERLCRLPANRRSGRRNAAIVEDTIDVEMTDLAATSSGDDVDMEPSDAASDSDPDDDDADDAAQAGGLGALETDVLLTVVRQLNDPAHSRLIGEHIDALFLGQPDVLHAICEICHHLMLYNRLARREYRLLGRLYFKPKFIRALWLQLTTQSSQLRFSSPINLLSRGISIPQADIRSVIPVLATFCSMFDHLIQTLHDGEFCQEDILPGAVSKIMPFTLKEIATISTGLKDVSLGLVDLAFPETRQSFNDRYRAAVVPAPAAAQRQRDRRAYEAVIWPHLMKVCVSLLRQLYTRDLRRGFCSADHWTVDMLTLPLDKPDDLHLLRRRRGGPRPFQPIRDFTKADFESDGPPFSTKEIRSITILREIPFVVPFNTRVGILQSLLSADKVRSQGEMQGFLQGPSINLMVRREFLYEDAYDKLRPENEEDLRPRFRVQLINSVGLEEVGIDGGGVFREFLSELIKAAFDPNRGFFMITTDNKLYPNPAVGVIVPDFQKHYYFIGRILGKALYENLLVELPLAEFFLSKLASQKSTVDVHQLASLDPVLHHNLLGLKSYDGEVVDLGLDFTVVSNELGGACVEELIPNGANIPVTNANRMEYIRQMADYKLNRQIRQQCAAFRRGLSNVINVEWLYMFSNKEFQVLISGAEIAVDLDDLQAHTRYGGEFGPDHPTIVHFWDVLRGFGDLQRRKLLKFVTSCSRPPLLGFKDLDPPFYIQNAGDTDRLPSASTCMNLLKLPAFPTAEVLREKLLYAIESGSGFELS